MFLPLDKGKDLKEVLLVPNVTTSPSLSSVSWPASAIAFASDSFFTNVPNLERSLSLSSMRGTSETVSTSESGLGAASVMRFACNRDIALSD